VRKALSELVFTRSPDDGAKIKRFENLAVLKESIEIRIARRAIARLQHVEAFHKLREADADQVIAALPPRTVPIDYLEYTHSTPSPNQAGRGMKHDRRLLAFVLGHRRAPTCVSLGPSQDVEKAVESLRKDLTTARPDSRDERRSAAQLASLVWEPLRDYLGDAETLLISPDGSLWQVPFAAFPGRREQEFLVENVEIGYVSSGRQLLEDALVNRELGEGLLAVGGVNYGRSLPLLPHPLTDVARGPPLVASTKLSWVDLPVTEKEVSAIAKTFRKFCGEGVSRKVLSGAEARKDELEATLKNHRWRYLHVATHGVIIDQQMLRIMRIGDMPLDPEPLLRSVLVFAGANDKQTSSTAYLTAEEILGLDLGGVELVVLSVNETSVGQIRRGEGTLSLASACHLAGARYVMGSLFKVDDYETAGFMTLFYTKLWKERKRPLAAMREAQVTLIRNPQLIRDLLGVGERGRPKFDEVPGPAKNERANKMGSPKWAAFVLSGIGREH
jgi:CHAT domain-containing protein